jgi:hypothetical protein
MGGGVKTFVDLPDGRRLCYGYDRPYRTFFAQLWDQGQTIHEPPIVVIGYSPNEQFLLRYERPSATVGPYPIATVDSLKKAAFALMGPDVADRIDL